MKKLLALFVLTVMISGNLTSCKKQSCPVDEPTKRELLTQAIWNFVKLERYDNDGNLLSTMQFNGDKLELTPAGNYYFYDDANRLSDVGIFTFIEGDPDQLHIASDQIQIIFTVDQLDEEHLVISGIRGNIKSVWTLER